MTTITGAGTYSPPSVYGQNTSRPTGTSGSSAASAGTTGTGNSSSTASSKSVADAIAAAADSAGYDFVTVGQNARTVLNAGITAYGQTPGSQTTDKEWVKIFGGMDRRSLYAVASNQGGQFSPQEQKVARTLMDNQLANAGNNVSASDSTSAQIAGYTQQVNLLNSAGPEEKKSASWAYSMADAQTAARMADIDSRIPQSSTSSPLLSTLMGAMYNVRSQSSSPVDFGTVSSLSDITAQPWAKSYASQIESAFAASYQPGGSYSVSV